MKEIELTLEYEGGYVDHPDDPGGETKFGISQKSYPHLVIKSLTREQAIDIYKRDFFDRYKLQLISSIRIRWKIFDMIVNLGPGRAIRYLQDAIGAEKDGIIGVETIRETNSADEEKLMLKLIERQAKHYVRRARANPSQVVFLEGWVNRAFETGDRLV